MSDATTFDPDALRKEFADYCTEVEPGIKAHAPKLNQLETLALIGMTLFQAAKELKDEKSELAARIAALESAAKAEPIYQTCFMNGQWRDVDRFEYDRAKGLRDDLARIVYTSPAATDNGGGRDAEDARRYRWLRDTLHGAKAGGGVEVNDALQIYEKPEPGKEVRVYWYQDTPVGFYESEASTLDEAIDAALSQKAGEQG